MDCFANYYNCNLSIKFFSRYWNPGCAGVDFFVQSLQGEDCFVVHPVCLIARAVNYLVLHKAVATFIVPFWPSSYFWPIISRKFYNFIVDYKFFMGRDVLEHGRNTNSLDQKGSMGTFWPLEWILGNLELNSLLVSICIS